MAFTPLEESLNLYFTVYIIHKLAVLTVIDSQHAIYNVHANLLLHVLQRPPYNFQSLSKGVRIIIIIIFIRTQRVQNIKHNMERKN